ncbi:ribosomal protein L7/L12 [Batrachochytrium salamandrivorans]|nr:ribosomal protein L7/L12 [Batrachochytrium salamandrivorans]
MFASAIRNSVVRPSLVKRAVVAARPMQFSSKAAMSDERIPSTPIVNKVLTVDQEKVQRIVDEVLSLNLLEVVHFTSEMEKAFDLPNINDTLFARLLSGAPAAVGSSAAPAAAAAATAAPVPEAAPQKASFDLKLESFGAGDKIKIIKLVREMSGLGLKEAKEKVEGAPTVLMKDLTKEAADEWLAKLTTAGGKGALE